jgi:ketopantoate reductase
MYDLGTVIESVVTPQHTCILVNTTNCIGIEDLLEERFPNNVVLSLVCNTELVQTGPTEFDHKSDTTELYIGWANRQSGSRSSIQQDMAEALAITLETAQVTPLVHPNIREQQLKKMMG